MPEPATAWAPAASSPHAPIPTLDVVLDLARYSQDIGADYVIVHSPVLHFGADTDETIYEYYRYLSEQLDIGMAMWNHPDCGYTMSPELCARIADLPNVVAIKYSTDRARYQRLTELAGDRIHVSNPSEEEWLDNIIDLGWKLYLCSTPPFLLQSAVDQRMNDYTPPGLCRQVRRSAQGARQPESRARGLQGIQATGQTPGAWQILAGIAGPAWRAGAAAAAGPDRGRAREDACLFRRLRIAHRLSGCISMPGNTLARGSCGRAMDAEAA